ncbi:hypothetical protein M9435_002614 [Picochlorum sp. BPE23]|nr:hypothetical protein M9435_002614 [Picochlorum sp. BPE23]
MFSKSLVLTLLGFATAKAAEFPYTTLLRSGQPADAEYPFGTGVTAKMDKVLTNVLSGEDYGTWDPMFPDNKTTVEVSNNPDFFSILDAPDGGVIGFVHFESPNPSQIYALGLDQADDGSLKVTSTEPVDFSEYGGAWVLCAGSVTPWGVHLGGEEYEPNAAAFEKASCLFDSQCEDSLQTLDPYSFGKTIEMLRYFDVYAEDGVTTLDDVKQVYDPYNYGWGVEVQPVSGSSGKGTKWYTTGRLSQELVYVMPNNKTVYITDDGTNVGFFRVELDTPGDMSSGTIYAAKLEQKSAENGGDFGLSWVELGSSTQEELKATLDAGLKFSDIFDSVDPVNGTCADGYTSINQGGRGIECIKLVEGQENTAAFFEPRRYGAYLGATTEASKWEGFVYDPYTNKAYTSISDVRYGMEDSMKKGESDDTYDIGGPNAIKLPYNPCGCVYALDMDDNYVATSFTAALCGKPMEEDEDGNSCALDGISNPDNVARIGKIILIGEDTSAHQNDMVWAWEPETGKLTRVATTPYGSESTGINLYEGKNGYSYLTHVTQHPYGETDTDLVGKDVNPSSEGPEGYVGYWAIPSSEDLEKVLFQEVPVPKTQEEKSKLNVAPIVNEIKSTSSPSPSSTTDSTTDSSTPSPMPEPTPSSSAMTLSTMGLVAAGLLTLA